ncbi:amidase signature domain-containing protein [Leucosporidium creatinivorum]|uniref:Amidase signature domain-containing protein n=1 Tax=Leucosporidium creatinivorum TaxID=106004 RepID=A0A1Y2BVD0_9BASI|nr:amidase signature domain-containing protein [Leucosporidium creatinivorum]
MLLRIPTSLIVLGLSLVSAAPTYDPQQQTFLPPPYSSTTPTLPILEEASLSQLLSGLRNGSFTSLRLTQAYLSRITAFNDLNAIITLNPHALTEAQHADTLRSNLSSSIAEARYPLLGLGFLVKDNIAIPPSSGPTTAGSYALVDAVVREASPVVQRLLDAGAVLLGTTNLDEFAQAKGDHPWAWSARGGQTKSIYAPEEEEAGGDVALQNGFGDVCGSSGGSALAVALGLASFTLGTQTGVSIVCPAGRAGVVGFKPGRGGMMPMEGVVPISKHLDVVGPIARTVEDAERVWRVIKHPQEWEGDEVAVKRRKGPLRIGVPFEVFQSQLIDEDDLPQIPTALSTLLTRLTTDARFLILPHPRNEVTNISAMTSDDTRAATSIITTHELKLGLNNYLKNWTLPHHNAPRDLQGIIDFNKRHSSLELPLGPFPVFGHPPRSDESYGDQSFLIKAQGIEVGGWQNASYARAREEVERVGWREGLKPYFAEGEGVDVMMVPTEGISGTIASLAGVPQITIPLSSLPFDYPLPSNATWPLYPHPSMRFGVSLLAPRGHGHHELLLEVARMVEEVLSKMKTEGDWMRGKGLRRSVRERLEALREW